MIWTRFLSACDISVVKKVSVQAAAEKNLPVQDNGGVPPLHKDNATEDVCEG